MLHIVLRREEMIRVDRMCELFCLSSRVPTVATFSLERFAAHGVAAEAGVDGWGLAFYEGRDLRLYREPEPASNSPWLAFIARARLPSRLILSHIRRATRGAISLANTQPFVRELGGRRHAFAHNGDLAGIAERHAGEWRHFQPVGESDSEIAFCLLLQRLWPLWSAGVVPPIERRIEVFARFAAQMRRLGPANFLYADGDALFAHGDRRKQKDGTIAPPGLWRLERRCAADPDALPQAGIALEGRPQELVLLASVPLTDEPWVPLAAGEVIVVREGALLARDPR
jgi:predicted glutamine amidotransferase